MVNGRPPAQTGYPAVLSGDPALDAFRVTGLAARIWSTGQNHCDELLLWLVGIDEHCIDLRWMVLEPEIKRAGDQSETAISRLQTERRLGRAMGSGGHNRCNRSGPSLSLGCHPTGAPGRGGLAARHHAELNAASRPWRGSWRGCHCGPPRAPGCGSASSRDAAQGDGRSAGSGELGWSDQIVTALDSKTSPLPHPYPLFFNGAWPPQSRQRHDD